MSTGLWMITGGIFVGLIINHVYIRFLEERIVALEKNIQGLAKAIIHGGFE